LTGKFGEAVLPGTSSATKALAPPPITHWKHPAIGKFGPVLPVSKTLPWLPSVIPLVGVHAAEVIRV